MKRYGLLPTSIGCYGDGNNSLKKNGIRVMQNHNIAVLIGRVKQDPPPPLIMSRFYIYVCIRMYVSDMYVRVNDLR